MIKAGERWLAYNWSQRLKQSRRCKGLAPRVSDIQESSQQLLYPVNCNPVNCTVPDNQDPSVKRVGRVGVRGRQPRSIGLKSRVCFRFRDVRTGPESVNRIG